MDANVPAQTLPVLESVVAKVTGKFADDWVVLVPVLFLAHVFLVGVFLTGKWPDGLKKCRSK